LSGNRCLPRGFSATTRFFKLTAVLRSETAHLCRALALAQLVTGTLFELGKICSFFTPSALALGAHFSFR
jgi:hypothetical protein